MSLTLLQGYSSDEQEGDLTTSPASSSSSSLVDDGVEREEDHEGEGDNGEETLRERSKRGKVKKRSLDEALNPPANSFLPSALDAFNEITGPPEFLNNCAAAPEETREALGVLDRKARSRSGRDRKDLPAGAVVEAKAQLVGIRERVRNDIEGSFPSSTPGTVPASKRIMSATNPDPKDAAELLRVCLQCGVPKTYSHARGMVCPLCGDRAPAEHTNESDKKKGSVVKDKEKMKRMKGQSSHATWKSETEMQLRQQYD